MKKNKKFKNLFTKLNKVKLSYRIFFFIVSTLLLLSIGLISYSLILLSNIETIIRIIVIFIFILYFFIYYLASLYLVIIKKTTKFIILNVLSIIFISINIFGFYYINKTYSIIDYLNKENITYRTSLISLNETEKIETVGIINKENDTEGYILPQTYLAVNEKKYKITYFDTNEELIENLLNKKIDAIFLTSNYLLKYTDNYPDLETKTKVIDTYSEEMQNQDNVASTGKSVTEPITILLLGVDSEYDGLSNNAAFNGDSIMLITFNPKTLSATMFSIPRDTYVPIACNNNNSYKINSAAAYGTKCMIDTVQNLTDITIDYYTKINFKGVVALVDALGGITLDIDEPDFKKNLSIDCGNQICEQNSNRSFGKDLVYITPGQNQTLNGEQALAYSRNRHQWALSDFKRVEHQQAVVSAIISKIKTIRSVDTFYKVLNAVSNNIDTNMSTKEILNFYNVGKQIILNNNFRNNSFINVQKTYLTGYDLTTYIGGANVYTFQYYEESLNEITNAMKINLGLIEPEIETSFEFSITENYEVPVIGKKYSSVKKNENLPDFTGSSAEYVESWAQSRNITINKEYINDTSCNNNKVISQSIHSGTMTENISSLTINVCKNEENNNFLVSNDNNDINDDEENNTEN